MVVRVVLALGLVASLALAVPAAWSGEKDCASARRARPCNPRQECLAQVERRLRGPALDAARRDCARMPTTGTCYGPDISNPQANCRERKQR